MDWEELDPKKKTSQKRDLSVLGLEELRDYISALEEEIVRARDAISAKEKVKLGAQALFKTP